MKNKFNFLFPIVILFIITTGYFNAQTVTICDKWGQADVYGGEYRIYNNVWGATTEQCIEIDQSSTYFKVVSSAHNQTGGVPASYPFILKGSHFGGTPTIKNNPLPIPVINISEVPISWSITTANASGTWNAALDIWFGVGSTNKLEMMVWINYKGGPTPAGSKISTVNIGGYTWDVYYNGSSVLSYKITTVRENANLDIKNFIDDAVTRGILNTTWDLLAIEAGFEIWVDGKNLTLNSFSAYVTPGITAFITSPTQGATYSEPANITINALASSPNGNITKVEFYEDNNKIGEDNSSPYSFTWTNVQVGNYTLRVKAIDESGDTATSSPVNISVISIPTGTSMEAEDTLLTNYLVNTNSYASKGKLIKLSSSGITGTAVYNFSGSTGNYDIKVWYFDENDGASTMRVYVDGSKVDEWKANQNLGSADAVSQTRTSRLITNVAINAGSQIKLEAIQDGQEWGRYDNIEVTPTPTSVEGESFNNIQHDILLLQNYPNPFNPSTVVYFEIGNPTQIELSVYNLLGNKLETLAKGFYQSGRYRVSFDASKYGAGIYFYQLKTPALCLTRKCVFIK